MKDSKKLLPVLSLGLLVVIGGLILSQKLQTRQRAIDPVAVKTAPSAVRKEPFAKDLALAGWRQTRDDSIVILVNTKSREYMRLKNHEPGPDGTKVKAAHLADRRADTFVELECNGETAVVRYDESFLRIRSSVMPLLPNEGIQLKEFFLESNKFVVSGKASTISHAMKFKADLVNDTGLHQYTWNFPQPTFLEDNQVSFRAEGTLTTGGQSHEGQ